MDSGEFIEKIIEEYNFAKSKGFDSIVIVIETSSGEHEISEAEDGFINDNFDFVFGDIVEIAEELYPLISYEKVVGFRIE